MSSLAIKLIKNAAKRQVGEVEEVEEADKVVSHIPSEITVKLRLSSEKFENMSGLQSILFSLSSVTNLHFATR